MPRRWYASVTVETEGGVKETYTGKAAQKIAEMINDSGYKPTPQSSRSEEPVARRSNKKECAV